MEQLSIPRNPGPTRHAEEKIHRQGLQEKMEATVGRSLTYFGHKLFISSALYYTRMMFWYPVPLGAVLNNRPLALGLSEGISSGASISQFVLDNLRRAISIKPEKGWWGGGGGRRRKCRRNGAFSCSLVVSAALPRS